MTTGPAHPLFYPIVPLAWALRASGHEVVIGAPESFAETVQGAALAAAPVSAPFTMPEVMGHDRDGKPITLPDTDEKAVVAVGQGFGRLAARTVDGTRSVVERWRPDVIVAESYSYGAAAAAAALHGVPWVKHMVGPGDMDIHTWMVEEFAPELSALGLDGLPEPALVVDNALPLMQEPVEGGQQIRYVPFGPPGPMAQWALDRSPGRPRVLVTLGTVQPMAGEIGSLERIVKAVAELPVDVVVAVADMLVDRLRPLPENVISAGWQCLPSVLPACDAVVHHGGPGTMMACLCNGLPQVIIPGRGKPLEAIGRLAGFGAAVQVPPGDAAPDAVRAACRSILDDPSFGEAARKAREQVDAMPSALEVVAALERLARG